MIIQVSIYERGRSFLRSNTLVLYFVAKNIEWTGQSLSVNADMTYNRYNTKTPPCLLS